MPKTRSGMVIRQGLGKIAQDDLTNLGDIATLFAPKVVLSLIECQ